jgi:tetratricopeptide (TPR) repeat protein
MIRQVGLGEPVAVSIPLLAALALSLRRTRLALLCGATASIGWLSTLQISERAPFVAVCAGLLLLAVISFGAARFRPRTARRATLLAAAFALAAALQFVPSPFTQTIHKPVFERLQGTSVTEGNTRARLLFWGAALEMFRSHPLTGVGAGGYDAAFAEARAAFSARHAGSPLVAVNENFLTKRAHNEYLQILAELGVAGLALFCAFCAALVWLAASALRRSRGPLVPGAVATLAAFALSSGASSLSFRWMSSGLVFFFAAALVTRFAPAATSGGVTRRHFAFGLRESLLRATPAAGLSVALAATAFMCAHAASAVLQAKAQKTADRDRAERLFHAALSLNPLDPAGRFNYGQWLVARKREPEAVGHLRYAVARGFNTSTCYQYLAGAESNAGETEASERTLALAARVYPRSVFARVRHASALRRLGREAEAGLEMSAAHLIDSEEARGWELLIEHDIDAAADAARRDPNGIVRPGELQPADAVMAVLQENEGRFPGAVTSGWRAQMRSVKIR